jgi:hypothetical protein
MLCSREQTTDRRQKREGQQTACVFCNSLLKRVPTMAFISETLMTIDWIGIFGSGNSLLKEKTLDDVNVKQMDFGKHSSQGKNRRKRGRPTAYPDDPKVKKTVYIRGSLLKEKPEDLSTSHYLENCCMSSMCT